MVAPEKAIDHQKRLVCTPSLGSYNLFLSVLLLEKQFAGNPWKPSKKQKQHETCPQETVQSVQFTAVPGSLSWALLNRVKPLVGDLVTFEDHRKTSGKPSKCPGKPQEINHNILQQWNLNTTKFF